MSPTSGSSPSRRPSPRRVAALTLALGVGVLTGCSGGSDSPAESTAAPATEEAQPSPSRSSAASPTESSSASQPMTLRATEVDFAIELPQTELTAGSYTIEVANDGDATHDLVIEDAGGNEVAASEVIAPGGSGTVEVDLEPGEYVFYCSVGNHRGMGMEVAVTVV